MTQTEEGRAVRRKLRELFGIDFRSLVVFRIGLGLMLLFDLVKRSLTLRAHYTESGLFPGEVALRTTEPTIFQAFLLSDGLLVQSLLFVFMGVLASCFVLGYRTRPVIVLYLMLLASLDRRNYWVLHTGDVFLFVLALWACFLPLGARFSLDRLRNPRPATESMQHVSVGSVALLLQIAVFYFAAGVLKLHHEVWTHGDAMWVFARIEEYTRPFGTLLGRFETLAMVLTYFTLVLECGGPFLLFSPLLTQKIRTVLVFVFMSFHLGIQLAVYIGVFELLSIVAVSVFLPAWFWDAVLPRVRVPAPVRRSWRVWGARLRGWVPERPPRQVPSWTRTAIRGLGIGWQMLGAGCLVVVLVANYGSLTGRKVQAMENSGYARQLGLLQNWSIFSDIEPLSRGWFLVIGQQEDGHFVDVLNDTSFDGRLKRPERFAETFPNHNMRRFWVQMSKQSNSWLRPFLADYLCRTWNSSHAARLVHLVIVHIGKVGRDDTEKMLPLINFHHFEYQARRRGVEYQVEDTPKNRALRADWERLLDQFRR